MAHPKLNDGVLACIRVGVLAGRMAQQMADDLDVSRWTVVRGIARVRKEWRECAPYLDAEFTESYGLYRWVEQEAVARGDLRLAMEARGALVQQSEAPTAPAVGASQGVSS